jgi:hypothetical protein
MSTVENPGYGGRRRRKIIVPEWRRHRLQLRLLALYRGDAQYQRLVARRLRPLWDDLKGSAFLYPYVKDNPSPPYHIHQYTSLVTKQHLLAEHPAYAGREEAAQVLASLTTYIASIDEFVRDVLRLTLNRESVEWAIVALHDDVRGQVAEDHGPNYRPKTHHAALHILLRPRQADLLSTVGGLTRISYAPFPVEQGEDIDVVYPETITTVLRVLLPEDQRPEVGRIGPGPAHTTNRVAVTAPLADTHVEQHTIDGEDISFEAWAELEKQAIVMLRDAIARLRQSYQGAYSHSANPSRLDEEETDLRELFGFLFLEHETPKLIRDTRQKVLALAHDIGIDLPRPASIKDKKLRRKLMQ